jgi:muramoyltetrapeptide carboxypeptidase
MVCALGRGNQAARCLWLGALERPLAPRRFRGLSAWQSGTAAGPLFGGNLAVLHSCAAAGRLLIPEGSVLLLEDVGERPYRVDRMLTDLRAAGHFANVSAVVVGDFLDCAPGPDGRRVEQVLHERLTGLGIPVLAGFPIGHGARNDPVTLGAHATVDGVRKSVVIEEA